MAVTHTHRSQAGAVAARTLLALFVIFGLVVLFLPSAPLGQPAGAQTASPSPTGPRIKFLNPSGTTGTSGPGLEVSASPDGVDSAYHLVAWVGGLPANPSVEFKYKVGANPEQPIPGVTLRGTDTYDAFWTTGSIPADGSVDLHAILFSNGVEVARDTKTVNVNNADAETSGPPLDLPTSENRGQTAEITYPQNAGAFGLYRKPGTTDPYLGVIDASSSPGTTNVSAYYTTSAPGTEPTWTKCHTGTAGETKANSADGVRCTLAAGVNPVSVTAVSVASEDGNQEPLDGCDPLEDCGEGPDSGDAHRSSAYIQTPSSITVTPATQQQNDSDTVAAGNQFPCSEQPLGSAIVATALDQTGRKVAGANLDAKAALPTDSLYFDDSGDKSSAHKQPDKNHSAFESTVDCESAANPRPFTAGSQQGVHVVSGEGDSKHIELPVAGTNDAGQFKFLLYNLSTTITGVTQFTAYYDLNDDDLMCSLEPQGDGSIGWGVGPGTPTGVADETTVCPEPSASPSGSSSGSPSSSPSTSTSPSSSSSASPSGSASPGTSRTLTLSASDAKVEAGDTITLNGQIISSVGSCEDNEFIRIRRRVHGTEAFENFRSVNSDAEGNFQATFEASLSADYHAFASAHDNCAEETSEPVTVLAKVKVSITVSEFRPQRGDKVRITGKVEPNHDGTKVRLQRKKAGVWVKVKRDVLSARSRYAFAIRADWKRGRLFRVKWIEGDSDHKQGISQKVKITTHR